MSVPRRPSEQDVQAVGDDLCAAALGDLTWEAALDRVFGLMDASLGAITVFETESGKLRQSVVHRADAAPAADAKDYRALDPRLRFLMGAGTGVAIYDYLHSAEGEIEQDPYYTWHTRAAKTRYYIGASVVVGQGLSAALSLHRSREQGQMQTRDVALYRQLLRHFERAMRIAVHVARATGTQQGWQTLIDESPLGMVFLDGVGKPLQVNAAARRMAALGDGFVIGDEGISALRRGDDAQLQRALAAALDAQPSEDGGGSLRLGRRTGEPDYLVVALRLPTSDRLFGILCARALVFITDPAARSGPSDDRLRQLFGLTPAELRLAGHLVHGATLEEAAKLSNVGLPTLRTQLAALFRKTGTSRQSELLRRLLSAPWQIGAL